MMRRMAALMGLMLALSLPAHAARLACVVEPPVAALVDDTGAEVIPSGVFTELFTVREDALYAAGEPGDYRLYDAEGVLVSDECFSMIHDAGNALIFCQDGLYGAMDSEGNVLIEPAWTQLVLSGEDAFLALDASPLDEQPDELLWLTASAEPVRTGVTTSSGLCEFADGRMPFMAPGGRWGAVDARGAVAIEPTWRYLGSFANGLAMAEGALGRGLVDVDGTVVVEPKYEWLDRSAAMIAARTADGEIDVYAPDGGLCFTLEGGDRQVTLVGAVLAVTGAEESRLYDANGALLLTASAEATFAEGVDGQVIVADGAWGERCQRLVNPDGSDASGPFQRILPLTSGRYAFLTMSGATYYSRDLGRIQTSWDYDSVRYGLMDGAGSALTEAVYREIRSLANGCLLMVSDAQIAVADADGNVLSAWPTAGTESPNEP